MRPGLCTRVRFSIQITLLAATFATLSTFSILSTLSMGQTTIAAASEGEAATCLLSALPGLSAQYARAEREASRLTASASNASIRAGYAEDFWQVAAGVLNTPEGQLPRAADHASVAGVGLPSFGEVPCDASVRARDRIAWSMNVVGYSAKEIADVVSGHLTRADLDQAFALLMAGRPRAAVTAFLEARWREARPDAPDATANAATSDGSRGTTSERSKLMTAAKPHAAGNDRILSPDLETALAALSRQHRVPPNLIRAVIAAESGGSARAVSRAGAIGLMQLMPPTAAALGVDPWQPLQNLRGGIAYLASLLRAYGENVTLALIAYNAGPQHADRVRAGRAVAYEETRRYLDAVAVRYPLH